MIAAWIDGGRVRIRDDLPRPPLEPGEAIIRVSMAGICGTDLELLRGYRGFSGIPGHEFVGRVEEGSPEWVGARVVAEINVTCRSRHAEPLCRSCANGRPTHCLRREAIGIHGRADVEAAATPPPASGRRTRLSATRRSIARHMTESMQIPQFTSMVDADASGLLEARAAAAAETGSRVSLDALLMALLVPVLRDHPVMNARLDGDEIEYFERYDIGVAVDTPDGLMVPVVGGADALSVAELSVEVLRLAAAARDRTLAPHELAGATATVNNVGALGMLAGTPMLPVGTSMIAAFGMARPVVRLIDGIPTEVPTMTVSATFDHRIIDGGASGRFLAQLKEAIEEAAHGAP